MMNSQSQRNDHGDLESKVCLDLRRERAGRSPEGSLCCFESVRAVRFADARS